MRHAINSSSIIGNSASNSSVRAMAAARGVHTHRVSIGKPLPVDVDVPVVAGPEKRTGVCVREALFERQAMPCMTRELAMWQTASFELPAAAWATFVLTRTTSV